MSEMTWNHRVVRRRNPDPLTEEWYCIHEVFYEDGRITGITEDCISPGGETPEELRKEIERFRRATEQPVLDYEDY